MHPDPAQKVGGRYSSLRGTERETPLLGVGGGGRQPAVIVNPRWQSGGLRHPQSLLSLHKMPTPEGEQH